MSPKHLVIFFLSLIVAEFTYAQDPAFSQFFSSPLNVNPALTGRINNKWRLISNLRDQWISPASPYTTGTISFDTKILKNKIPETSVLGIGGMLMYDQDFAGIQKGNYLSMDLSYNIKLAESEDGEHRLGVGFGATYINKVIDFSALNFGRQFTGFGFDNGLPSGETALSNMKPCYSASSGFIYSYTSNITNVDLGVAGFHLNKPKQTVVKDPHQFLPPRYVVHGNFETILNDYLVLNTNAIYQAQSGTSYFSVGGALGYYLSKTEEEDIIVNGGLWYWSNNAVIPYVGIVYKNFQFGLTYDITVSKLSQASGKPKTFELSLIIRGNDKPAGIIPCPWK